ncbi:MAG: hypothetical protein V9E87_17135 [Gemmatimonadales bacterium]
MWATWPPVVSDIVTVTKPITAEVGRLLAAAHRGHVHFLLRLHFDPVALRRRRARDGPGERCEGQETNQHAEPLE